MKRSFSICHWILFIGILIVGCEATKKVKSWRDKDIRDMNDADLEHLLEEWEKNDDPLEPDELPEHLRPSPKIDLSQLDMTDPDSVLKATKRGKGVMMFVDVREDVPVEEADVVMRIWQTGLHNNHVIAERYPIDQRRSIFMFREGSQAIDAKKFFLEQPELSHVTLEGQTYYREDKDKSGKTGKKQAKGKDRTDL